MHRPIVTIGCQPSNTTAVGRCVWLCAVVMLVQLLGTQRVEAGCRYAQLHHNARAGFGQAITADSTLDSARKSVGHVRNFQFLGQWVYERGDIRYVPWQSEPACDGPNCHANPEPPVSTTGAPSIVLRSQSGNVLLLSERPFDACALSQDLSMLDECPQAGYPAAFEYPP